MSIPLSRGQYQTIQDILNHLAMDYCKTMEKYILLYKVYFLVNLKSSHARVLNWAIQENIRPVELAPYRIFPNWASSTHKRLLIVSCLVSVVVKQQISARVCSQDCQKNKLLEAFLGFLGKTKIKAYTQLTVVMWCQILAPSSGDFRRRLAPRYACGQDNEF